MIFEIDFRGGIPIYRQVMDQLRRQILTGHLKPGDQIESVKRMSARLKINPMTVSKAFGFLVEEGLLERRRGVGVFVTSVRKDIKRRKQEQLVDEAMKKVAALAVQMGIPEEEAIRLLVNQYRKFQHTNTSPVS